jgi:hypothetical protein
VHALLRFATPNGTVGRGSEANKTEAPKTGPTPAVEEEAWVDPADKTGPTGTIDLASLSGTGGATMAAAAMRGVVVASVKEDDERKANFNMSGGAIVGGVNGAEMDAGNNYHFEGNASRTFQSKPLKLNAAGDGGRNFATLTFALKYGQADGGPECVAKEAARSKAEEQAEKKRKRRLSCQEGRTISCYGKGNNIYSPPKTEGSNGTCKCQCISGWSGDTCRIGKAWASASITGSSEFTSLDGLNYKMVDVGEWLLYKYPRAGDAKIQESANVLISATSEKMTAIGSLVIKAGGDDIIIRGRKDTKSDNSPIIRLNCKDDASEKIRDKHTSDKDALITDGMNKIWYNNKLQSYHIHTANNMEFTVTTFQAKSYDLANKRWRAKKDGTCPEGCRFYLNIAVRLFNTRGDGQTDGLLGPNMMDSTRDEPALLGPSPRGDGNIPDEKVLSMYKIHKEKSLFQCNPDVDGELIDDFKEESPMRWEYQGFDSKYRYKYFKDGGIGFSGDNNRKSSMRSKAKFSSCEIKYKIKKTDSCSDQFLVISSKRDYRWSWGRQSDSISFVWNCNSKCIYGPRESKCVSASKRTTYDVNLLIQDSKVTFKSSPGKEVSIGTKGMDIAAGYYVYIGADQDNKRKWSKFYNIEIGKYVPPPPPPPADFSYDFKSGLDKDVWDVSMFSGRRYNYGFDSQGVWFNGDNNGKQTMHITKPLAGEIKLKWTIDKSDSCDDQNVQLSPKATTTWRWGRPKDKSINLVWNCNSKCIYTQGGSRCTRCSGFKTYNNEVEVRDGKVTWHAKDGCPQIQVSYGSGFDTDVPYYILIGADQDNRRRKSRFEKISAKGITDDVPVLIEESETGPAEATSSFRPYKGDKKLGLEAEPPAPTGTTGPAPEVTVEAAEARKEEKEVEEATPKADPSDRVESSRIDDRVADSEPEAPIADLVGATASAEAAAPPSATATAEAKSKCEGADVPPEGVANCVEGILGGDEDAVDSAKEVATAKIEAKKEENEAIKVAAQKEAEQEAIIKYTPDKIGVTVQYRTSETSPWTDIKGFPQQTFSEYFHDFATLSMALPIEAMKENTQVRFIQKDKTCMCCDPWDIRDVKVTNGGNLIRMGADKNFKLWTDGNLVGSGAVPNEAYEYAVGGFDTVAIEANADENAFGILGNFGTGLVTDAAWKCLSADKAPPVDAYGKKWNEKYFDDSSWPYASEEGSNSFSPDEMLQTVTAEPQRIGLKDSKWIWAKGFNSPKVFCRVSKSQIKASGSNAEESSRSTVCGGGLVPLTTGSTTEQLSAVTIDKAAPRKTSDASSLLKVQRTGDEKKMENTNIRTLFKVFPKKIFGSEKLRAKASNLKEVKLEVYNTMGTHLKVKACPISEPWEVTDVTWGSMPAVAEEDCVDLVTVNAPAPKSESEAAKEGKLATKASFLEVETAVEEEAQETEGWGWIRRISRWFNRGEENRKKRERKERRRKAQARRRRERERKEEEGRKRKAKEDEEQKKREEQQKKLDEARKAEEAKKAKLRATEKKLRDSEDWYSIDITRYMRTAMENEGENFGMMLIATNEDPELSYGFAGPLFVNATMHPRFVVSCHGDHQ